MSNQLQYYRKASVAGGVNADAVSTRPGSEGANVTFCCLTEAWAAHSHLPPSVGASISTDPGAVDRGLGVLGLVLAHEVQGDGIIGLAAAATPKPLEIPGPGAPNRGQAIATAIHGAVRDIPLVPGDVLLIDALGATGDPVEALPEVYDAIRFASQMGIVVVEPAGDSNMLITTLPQEPSGALIVAAATVGRDRTSVSNFGSRVGLFALGAQVLSLRVQPSSPGQAPYHFKSTSLGTRWAAAIIAGAALSAQGMVLAATGRRLAPAALRHLLLEGAASSQAPSSTPIGAMPDLDQIAARIAPDAVYGVPDVYVRDFEGDTGDSDPSHPMYMSPDIDVVHKGQNTSMPPPFPASMPGKGEIELGEENHFYVRVRNRGKTAAGDSPAATDVVARVYWSLPTTLPAPSTWTANLIGEAHLGQIAADDSEGLLGPIAWTPPDDFTYGTVCLIAVVGSADDPPPRCVDLLDVLEFERMVQWNNNIAWRNCATVNNDPDLSAGNTPLPADGFGDAPPESFDDVGPRPPAHFVPLDVTLPGLPVGRRRWLAVAANLPPGSQLLIHAPEAVVPRPGPMVMRPVRTIIDDARPVEVRPERPIRRRPTEVAEVLSPWWERARPRTPLVLAIARWLLKEKASGLALIPLEPHGTTVLRLDVAEPARATVRLLVHIPPERRHERHEIVVIDRVDGREIGRFTFTLARDGRPGLREMLANVRDRLERPRPPDRPRPPRPPREVVTIR